jgi:[ribosomal protein S5]-alanine N-acetyltransferase
MQTPTLATARLTLRPWELGAAADVRDAHQMYRDPEIHRYLRGVEHASRSIAQTRALLARWCARATTRCDGSCFWALCEPGPQGAAVGMIALQRLPLGDPDDATRLSDDWEVGWHLRRDRWGRGYASEGARAALGHAFDAMRLDVVYAVTHLANAASQAVARRIGMQEVGKTQAYYGGDELALFEIRRPVTRTA